jgi:pyrroline-5-carboxylate reductase
MEIGFIGFGLIANAVAIGLLTSTQPPSRIVLSPRNAERAAALRERFPLQVVVAASNQEVLDLSCWVFIAVRPPQAKSTMSELRFKGSHKICSLMAGITVGDLSEMLRCVPLSNISCAIPLPPVADHQGVTLIHPRNKVAEEMFECLGTSVGVDDSASFLKLQTISGMMGCHYKFLQTCHKWLVDNGVDSIAGSKYVGALMHCVSMDGLKVQGVGFQGLIDEQVKGGFNEQGIEELDEAGVWNEIYATLISLNARWEGRAQKSELRPVHHCKQSRVGDICTWKPAFLCGVATGVAISIGGGLIFQRFRSK